ncbi:alpha/beta fold hydrolase [Agromyces sp. NPDC056965]|uniref:alpha/beta fold hydrolase n=1 Tax=Agromyces sp. NPDC056965 TaxID=3345983 RepID=UPI003629C613
MTETATSRWQGHPQGRPGWAPTRDGRRLFFQAIDGPGPTVVFEAGIASTRSIWGLVQPAIGRTVRSVAYDRAGLGQSPEAAGARRLPALANDLNDLLDHLELLDRERADDAGDAGFVLVGHSWGGPIVRLATSARPDRIRGLVLVDPADEDCELYYSTAVERSTRIQNSLFPGLARLGILRRVYGLTTGALPPHIRADARREMYTSGAVATQVAESTSMAEDLRALQSASGDLPAIPLTVISGGKSAGVGAEGRRQLIAAHRARAERAEHGRHVVAERSGHVVMLSEPEVVSAEIRRVLNSSAR